MPAVDRHWLIQRFAVAVFALVSTGLGLPMALGAAAIVCSAIGITAAHGSQYEITSIGTLPGHTSSGLVAVSPDGRTAVGGSGGRAILWTRAGGLVDLGVLPGGTSSVATAISDDGTVVAGQSESSDRERAFRWTNETGMQDLGKLTPAGWSSWATGISGDGQVIVGTAVETTQIWAVKWTASSGIEAIEENPGFQEAWGISRDGQVVIGTYRPDPTVFDSAAKWTAEHGVQSLGLLPEGGQGWASAYGLNSDGSIIVGTNSLNPGNKPVVWRNSLTPEELPHPPGSTLASLAATSETGTVMVGTGSVPFEGARAAIWLNMTQALWLDDYLAGIGVDLTGWSRLETATGISSDGMTIIGNGIYNGETRGFVVTVPEPSTHAGILGGLTFAGYWLLRRTRRA